MNRTFKHLGLSGGAVFSLLALTACGGGGGGGNSGTPVTSVAPPVSAAGPTANQGVITALGNVSAGVPGSVFVNGIEYAVTGTTTILVDGAAGAPADLKPGRVARVTGTSNDLTRTGSASRIEIRDVLQGTIDSIDTGISNPLTAHTITVLGQVVHIEDNLTHMDDDSIKLMANVGYNSGDMVEVHGFADSVSGLRATRVDRIALADLEVKGFISSLDLVNGSFFLAPTRGGVEGVSVGFVPGPGGQLPAGAAEGSLVDVAAVAPPSGGVILASAISLEDPIGAPGAGVELEGYVANGVLAAFMLEGQAVASNGATLFEGGLDTDFDIGVRLQAEGTLDANGVLVASRIRFANPLRIEGDVTDLLNGFTVLGMTVGLGPFTRVDSGIDLLLNRHVLVSATTDLNGALMATRVDVLPESAHVSIQGPVTAFDAVSGTMTILGRPLASSGASQWRAGSTALLGPTSKADFFARLIANATVVKVSWNAFGLITDPVDVAEIELGN